MSSDGLKDWTWACLSFCRAQLNVFSLLAQGQCECRPHVEGPACDRCKPLYWNLSPDSPFGCSSKNRRSVGLMLFGGWRSQSVCCLSSGCECNTAGTLSGVAECAQVTAASTSSGDAFFFLLWDWKCGLVIQTSVFVRNRVSVPASPASAVGLALPAKTATITYSISTTLAARVSVDASLESVISQQCGSSSSLLVCLGCQCDVGGSLGPFCEDQNGQCRCRSNVEGPKCDVWVQQSSNTLSCSWRDQTSCKPTRERQTWSKGSNNCLCSQTLFPCFPHNTIRTHSFWSDTQLLRISLTPFNHFSRWNPQWIWDLIKQSSTAFHSTDFVLTP